jgi:hypothetical protein
MRMSHSCPRSSLACFRLSTNNSSLSFYVLLV